jgi:hypothetical protein
MKKILITFLVGVAFVAGAQTNVVKVSALPSASTPLSGTEIVPLNQSGTTKTATVGQIIAAAITQDNATSNALQSAISANASAITASSNALSAAVVSNSAAILSSSNAFNNSIIYLQGVVSTGQAYLNSLFANYYPLTNPSNYQSGAQVLATANAAATAAVSGALNTNGTATFTSVTVPVVTYPPLNLGTQTNGGTFLIDGSKAALQYGVISWQGGGNKNCTLTLTNLAAGQNFTVALTRTDVGIFGGTYTVTLPSNAINLNSGGATSVTVPNTKTCVVTFTTLGSGLTNVIMSASLTP